MFQQQAYEGQQGPPSTQQPYCYENEQQRGQAQESVQTASTEFSQVFANLYSNQSQLAALGGNYSENQDQSFYQNSAYYSVQQSMMMHQGHSVAGQQQDGFGGYPIEYNQAYPQDQHQPPGSAVVDTCYMGGAIADNFKSDYMISKEQREAASLSHFYVERCAVRQAMADDGIKEILPIVQTLLKDVEQQEPRFVYQLMNDGSEENASMLSRSDGETLAPSLQNATNIPKMFPDGTLQRIPSIRAISTYEFQIVLFLNQMAVFNCIDDGLLPGYAALKLCDGRKRSMSLWVEFITASGYLSAKKLRSRFHALLMTAVDKQYAQAPHIARFDPSNGSVLIYNKYIVSIVPGFRCRGCWPTSARNLNSLPRGSGSLYVSNNLDNAGQDGQQSLIGFTLIANEVFNPNASQANATSSNTGLVSSSTYQGRDSIGNVSNFDPQNQQQRRPTASADSDTWQINVFEAEGMLLKSIGTQSPTINFSGQLPISGRVACLRVLKTLRDQYDGLAGITNHQLATLVLWEWEKHPASAEWVSTSLPDRIRSILLQLINCLQNQRLDHYLLANVNILHETNIQGTTQPNAHFNRMARNVWQLLRQLTFNFNELNRLI